MKNIEYYAMYVDDGLENKMSKKLQGKKGWAGNSFYQMLIPKNFKDMVEGFYNKQNKLPYLISWHKDIEPYRNWVDDYCEELCGKKPKHLFHR